MILSESKLMKNVCFRLPFTFDSNRLLADLAHCQTSEWKLHFNQKDFTGTWSSFALRSISGKENDISSIANANYQDTQTLLQCAYFQEVISAFDCPKEAIRLLSLSPKSYIKEHIDDQAGYESGFLRIHIPIQTNPQVIFRVNQQILPMKSGECWYANFNLPHFVSNDGEIDRIHLVIDAIRNDWTDKLFKEIDYDFEFEKQAKQLDRQTKIKMINELELLNTDTAKHLISQLKNELAILN